MGYQHKIVLNREFYIVTNLCGCVLKGDAVRSQQQTVWFLAPLDKETDDEGGDDTILNHLYVIAN